MKNHSPDPINTAPVFIPENFDTDRILDGIIGLQERTRRSLKAGMYLILDAIHNLSLNREYQDQFEKEGGYPLNAQLLKEILGAQYKKVLDLLEEKDVIVRHPE